MNNNFKTFFVFLLLSGLSFAQTRLIIQGGNSIFIPIGCQLCADNIIVETNASYVTEDSSGTCEGAVVTGEGEIQFPVELISFSANVDKKGNVLLEWLTANEVNNYGFEIERSNSDKLVFKKIAFIAGNGNSNSIKYYFYLDKLNSFETKYYYRLIQIDTDGRFSIFNTIEVEVNSFKEYYLSQNYPNPFNSTTKIRYSINDNHFVSLKVYDALGSEVESLAYEYKPAGRYEVNWDTGDLVSGIYIYKLQAGNFTDTKKLILMK